MKFIEENNKKVLFITVDNVEILENQEFLILYPDNTCGEFIAKDNYTSFLYKQEDGRLLFSSKEALDDYKLKHAKLLSYIDVCEYLQSSKVDVDLLNLVKERLNQK